MASSGTKLGHCKNALEGDIGTLDQSSPSFLLAYQEMSRPPSRQTPYYDVLSHHGPKARGPSDMS